MTRQTLLADLVDPLSSLYRTPESARALLLRADVTGSFDLSGHETTFWTFIIERSAGVNQKESFRSAIETNRADPLRRLLARVVQEHPERKDLKELLGELESAPAARAAAAASAAPASQGQPEPPAGPPASAWANSAAGTAALTTKAVEPRDFPPAAPLRFTAVLIVIYGLLVGVVLNALLTYVGLRMGLIVGAAAIAAVASVVVASARQDQFAGMVYTLAASTSAPVAGVVFTIPLALATIRGTSSDPAFLLPTILVCTAASTLGWAAPRRSCGGRD
jgi:hypothetical protein